MEHHIVKELLNQRVQVHLAGVGGNGAQMAACLARLDLGMRALGHPDGLYVTAIDDDVVTAANVGRQLYSAADIGQLKAAVTLNRLNLFYGLDWESVPTTVEEFWRSRFGERPGRVGDILVSCVDSRAARQVIHEYVLGESRYHYWIDLGNREHDGQVVLGQPGPVMKDRLRCVTELYPELLEPDDLERDVNSCSVRLSLASQGLFINDFAARFASQLLYTLFSHGRLKCQGAVFNVAAMQSRAIAIRTS